MTTPASASHSVSQTRSPHEVVRASAGTGKTYDLSTRYLGLLRLGANPDEILATTFTRKAAGEILQRVLQRLVHAATDDRHAATLTHDLKISSLGYLLDQPARPLTARDCRVLLALVCRRLHRVAISTLDSFFHRMAMCFRHEMGIGSITAIASDDDPAVAQIRARAIDATLADLADQDVDELENMLRRLHHDSAKRSVTQTIELIVAGDLYDVYRQNPDAKTWSQLTVPPGELKPLQIAAAINDLRELTEQMPNKTWADALKKNREAAQDSDWSTFLTKGIAKSIASGQPKFARRNIPDPVIAAYRPLIDHATATLVARVAHATTATHRLIERFDTHFTRLRRRQGILLYSDIPLMLSRTLAGADPDQLLDIYYRLDARVGHLLLDEFQDTSVQQWAGLRPFAQEICAHADASRTFYCAGDVKQAIYGWRGGCAELFDQIEQELNLSHSQKTTSRRSSQVVLDAVNQVFSQLPTNPAFDTDTDAAAAWAKGFQDHHAHHTDRPGFVALKTSPHDPLAQDDDTTPDPDPNDPNNDDTSQPTTITQHDIYTAEQIKLIAAAAPSHTVGVLVNINKHARLLIDLLRDLDVHASGEGGTPLTDDPAVNAMLSALTLADHPGHTAAAFHTASSPLGPVIGLQPDHLTHAATVASKIRHDLITRGYASVLMDWAKRLATHASQRSVMRMTQLLELADRYDAATTLRPHDFVAFVQATSVGEPSPAPVRVMTINKSKGLEFDTVVLAQLDQRLLSHHDDLVYVDRPLPTQPARSVFRAADKTVRSLCPQLTDAHQQFQHRRLHDDLSKLYVAMTRARHALHMFVKPLGKTKDKKTNTDKPKAAGWSEPSFAAILRRALSQLNDAENPTGQQTLYTRGRPDWHTQLHPPNHTTAQPPAPSDTERITIQLAHSDTPGHKPARRSWRQVSPSSLEAGGRVRVTDLLTLQPSVARQRGSLIHAWFEQIGWLDPQNPTPPLTDEQLIKLAQLAAPTMDLAWVRQQLDQFKKMLRHAHVAHALAKPTLQPGTELRLWRERDFAVRLDTQPLSGLLRGKFDRVVVHDRAHVPIHAQLIDFKTDRVTPDTLDDIVQRYEPQVSAYCAALAVMLQLSPTAVQGKLLFVDSGQCIDLPR